MNKLLPTLSIVCLATLVASGLTKHDEHGLLGVVSNVSWAAFLCCALALVVIGAGTLVHRTAR